MRRISILTASFASACLLALVVPCGTGAAVVEAAEEPTETERVADVDDALRARGAAYYHLMRALYVARQGELADATRQLRKAVELAPESSDLKSEAAQLYFEIGQKSEAERLARDAIELDGENANAIELLAEIVVNRAVSKGGSMQELLEAVALYDRLSKIPDAPVGPEVFKILGNLKLELGDLDGAIEASRLAVERAPSDPQGVWLLMQALLRSERTTEAISALLDYLVENPSLDERRAVLQNTVKWLTDLVRQEDAWELVVKRGEAAIRSQPGVGELHALYGEALLRVGRDSEGVGELERAVDLSEDADSAVSFYLANAYAGMGRVADAVEIAQTLADRFPSNPAVLQLLGETHARRGEDDRAIEAMRRSIDAFGAAPDHEENRDQIRRRIAGLQLERGDLERAADTLEGLERPDAGGAVEIRALLAIEQGHYRDARKLVDRLMEMGAPGRDAAEPLEAEIFVREEKWRRAREVYERIAERAGPRIYARAAESFRTAGNAALAETVLREWVDAHPDDAVSHFALGAFLEGEDRFDEAEPALRRSLELDPQNPEVLNYLGYSLADRDRELEEALALILQALEIDPWNGAILDSLGWVYYRLGRYEDAVEPLERAARELPRDPVVLDHLGDLYLKLGRFERARELWARALDQDAEDEDAIRRKLAGSALEKEPRD